MGEPRSIIAKNLGAPRCDADSDAGNEAWDMPSGRMETSFRPEPAENADPTAALNIISLIELRSTWSIPSRACTQNGQSIIVLLVYAACFNSGGTSFLLRHAPGESHPRSKTSLVQTTWPNNQTIGSPHGQRRSNPWRDSCKRIGTGTRPSHFAIPSQRCAGTD